jgi:hypothetical protein
MSAGFESPIIQGHVEHGPVVFVEVPLFHVSFVTFITIFKSTMTSRFTITTPKDTGPGLG